MFMNCPSCAGNLNAERLRCPSCDIAIEGDFSLPPVLRLSRAQLDFAEVFLKNRGIIREVERELGVSYPTVRARLDEVIQALGFNVSADREREETGDTARDRSMPRAVLEELSQGRITPEQALAELRVKGRASTRAPADENSTREGDDDDPDDA